MRASASAKRSLRPWISRPLDTILATVPRPAATRRDRALTYPGSGSSNISGSSSKGSRLGST